MCHTNLGTKEKKVVIRYLLQVSFPLTKRTLSNFIVFDINLCRSIPPQSDHHSPLQHRAVRSQIIQVCAQGGGTNMRYFQIVTCDKNGLTLCC
jgi:hypothetical protein